MPVKLGEEFQASTKATEEFECPVCFFELYRFNVGVGIKHSKRVCGHYFHSECAKSILKNSRRSRSGAVCPICGVSYTDVKSMPDMGAEPRDWFALVDIDFSGELSAFEVIEALGATLPASRKKLQTQVNAHWHEWDPDGDGTITMQEFIKPESGMRDWLVGHKYLLVGEGQEHGPRILNVPALDKSPLMWFNYWDQDKSGTLEKDEVVRALIRTFCMDEQGKPSLRDAFDMRESAVELWTGLGYRPFDSVTFDEFVKPYGLMDQFVHNLMNCMYVSVDDPITW